jgi:hypothetical protein
MVEKRAGVEGRLNVLALISILAVIGFFAYFTYFIYMFFSTPVNQPIPSIFGIAWIIFLLGIFALWFWIEMLIKMAKMKKWVWFILSIVLGQIGLVLAIIYFYSIYRKNPVQ